MTRRTQDGQVLALFAICLTLLIGISALVVDIGVKYSTERRYQSIADAASLAGAQELQPTERSQPITVAMQDEARAASLKTIVDEIAPGTTPVCTLVGTVYTCSIDGGSHEARITTPSPGCVQCDVQRAVQVVVAQPAYSTTFARIFGQTTWRLERTSVAGLSFGKSYTIVALRPPKPRNGSSIEVRDIFLNGGTKVIVSRGDVGSNSNMDYGSETNTLLQLATGYRMYYYDPDPSGPAWGSNPPGTHIGTMIADPMYVIPGNPAPADPRVNGLDPACQALVTAQILSQPKYEEAAANIIPRDNRDAIQWDKIWCYKPGTYTAAVQDSNAQLLTVLEPGLYYFAGGLDVNHALVGGYDAADMGVTLMFPRTKQFFQRAGSVIVLNAGSKYRNGGAGTEPAQAPAMTGTTPNLKITLIVHKDPDCQVLEPYNTACHDPVGGPGGSDKNQALNLGGGAGIYLAGVQYAPTDNVKIAGNTSGSEGYVGQIWAWTIEYVGSTMINQSGVSPDGPGRIRIDTACSPSESVCN